MYNKLLKNNLLSGMVLENNGESLTIRDSWGDVTTLHPANEAISAKMQRARKDLPVLTFITINDGQEDHFVMNDIIVYSGEKVEGDLSVLLGKVCDNKNYQYTCVKKGDDLLDKMTFTVYVSENTERRYVSCVLWGDDARQFKDVKPGDTVAFIARVKEHPQYGKTYVVKDLEEVVNTLVIPA